MALYPLPKRYHPDFAVPGLKPIGPVEIDRDAILGKTVSFFGLVRSDGLYDAVSKVTYPLPNAVLKVVSGIGWVAEYALNTTDILTLDPVITKGDTGGGDNDLGWDNFCIHVAKTDNTGGSKNGARFYNVGPHDSAIGIKWAGNTAEVTFYMEQNAGLSADTTLGDPGLNVFQFISVAAFRDNVTNEKEVFGWINGRPDNFSTVTAAWTSTPTFFDQLQMTGSGASNDKQQISAIVLWENNLPESDSFNYLAGTDLFSALKPAHPMTYFVSGEAATGRIMGALAGHGGLAGPGGLAGNFGGMAG